MTGPSQSTGHSPAGHSAAPAPGAGAEHAASRAADRDATAPPARPSTRQRRELSTEEYLARTRRRAPKWVVPALAAIVVLLGVGVTLIYYRNFGVKQIDARVTAYQASDHDISITFETTRRDADRPLACVLAAIGPAHETLATLDVPVPAGAKQTTLTRTLTTPSRPVTGQVQTCTYAAG